MSPFGVRGPFIGVGGGSSFELMTADALVKAFWAELASAKLAYTDGLIGWLLDAFEAKSLDSLDKLTQSGVGVLLRNIGPIPLDSEGYAGNSVPMDALIFGTSRNPRVLSGEWKLSKIFSKNTQALFLAASIFSFQENILLDLASDSLITVRWGVSTRAYLPVSVVKVLLNSAYVGDVVANNLQHHVSVPETVRVMLSLLEEDSKVPPVLIGEL